MHCCQAILISKFFWRGHFRFLPISVPSRELCAHVYHVDGGTCGHREGHSPGNFKGMGKNVGIM